MIDANYNIDIDTGCWIWSGVVSGNGYGKLRINGRQVSAHRVAYQEFIGPIPRGMCVCHSCDTPLCVNPSHLWLGTHQDNMRDMIRKGRHGSKADGYVPHRQGPKGERARTAKLDAAKVLDIRNSRSSCAELAEKYGITARAIAMVRSFETWGHI